MSARIIFAASCALALIAQGVTTSAAGAVPEFHMQESTVRTLENGLRVAVFPRPGLPIVQIQLLVDAGSVTDPEDAPGLAMLTSQLLKGGTSSRSAGAFALDVDRLAGSIEATATRDYATVDGAFLARDLDAALELMSDLVVNPVFPEAELRVLQTKNAAAQAALRRNPSLIADEQLWGMMFPRHPYGRLLSGTPSSIAGMTPEKIRAFYLAHYRPDRATLAIAGDLTPERAFAAVQDWFGRWLVKSETGATRVARLLPLRSGSRIRIVDVPNARLTQVRVGFSAPERRHDDAAAFALANVLFGGGSSSPLARAVGGEFGSAARSSYTLLRGAGLFACVFATPTDSVAAALRRLREELRRFTGNPPGAREVEDVRRTAIQVFPMRFETLGGVVGEWSSSTFNSLQGESGRDLERLRAVDAGALAAVARRWLSPDWMTIVAVGPAAVLKPELESWGDVEIVGMESPPQESALESSPPTPAQEARGRELVKLALAAHGGRASLARIKDSTIEADATLTVNDRGIRGEIVQIRKEPDRMLYTTRFGDGLTVQALIGSRGWSSTEVGGASAPMDSVAVAGMRSGFHSDLPHLLLAADAPDARVASRGTSWIGGRGTDAVEMQGVFGRRVLYLDALDHRLVAMDQQETTGDGKFVVRRIYGVHRQVQDVWWPFTEERQLDGRRVMLLEMRRVVLNSNVKDEVFEQHPAAERLPAR